MTREERFFCAHLFERIKAEGAHVFVGWLRSSQGLALDPNHTWEVAYEACFHRDLWHHRGKAGELYSPKRTFDVALLSDDTVVIVEAKAQQPFDEQQVNVFGRDRAQVIKETGVGTVLVLGLCSSRCSVPARVQAIFDGRILTWKELARRYDDPVLARADEIYEESAGFGSYGRNNASGKLTGAELVDAHARGERFFVGRGGGLDGPNVRADVSTGRWRNQRYETNRDATGASNTNWFSLDHYVTRVRRGQ